jgi:putative ABC transport system permease protein
MNLYAIVRVAWHTLMRHKTRSALTALGIIIGVASVITMVAIGNGARALITQQISSMGANLIMIFPGSWRQGAVRGGLGTIASFRESDAKAIAEECPSVSDCLPLVRAQCRAVVGGQNWPTRVFGAYARYIRFRGWTIAEGGNFTEQDERRASKVCLIGQTVATNLFGDGVNPVGAIIRLGDVPFEVIGLLAPKGPAPWGEDQDDIIYAPFATVQRRLLNIDFVHTLECAALSADVMDAAQEEIRALLRQRRRVPPHEDDTFAIRNQVELLRVQMASSGIMRLLLGLIASVALLVGGIGVMNIMLVSVTERTREIGIRMAVGARSRDVMLQFLIEAIMLTVCGGLIGVALGLVASHAVHLALHWPILISPWAISAAVTSTAVIGIAFGVYPAITAARLDPIAALRSE